MLRRIIKVKDGKSILSAERMLLLVTAGILLVLLVMQYANIQARKRDDERRSDLYNIQLSIQKYFALNGHYPTNLSGLSLVPDTCRDPSGEGDCKVPDYTYKSFATHTKPTANKTPDCNNSTVPCGGYALYSQRMESTNNPYTLTSR